MHRTATELTVKRWVATFKARMAQIAPNARRSIIMRALPRDAVLEAWSTSARRLIMLDYDAVRSDESVHPLTPAMRRAIATLGASPGAVFCLLSASTCEAMEREVRGSSRDFLSAFALFSGD
jgi:hypothetical protein